MDPENALAAGQGGTTTILAPQSQDEVYRQSAVAALADYLARGSSLLTRCETLAKAVRGDRIGPLQAAARLLNANAQVARALAHVALVEHRSRTIVETIQKPDAKLEELNSHFAQLQEEEDREQLRREIDRITAFQDSEQERLEGLAIGCCI